ncbi:MAG TPA: hypothetical protein VHZ75_02670 [Solirubrobacteraceae bacterium]|nr:hypothetical protein [Solirubrobacteraceae bacterium]
MRESRPAHTFRRRTISIAAIAVTALGATSAQALAATFTPNSSSFLFENTTAQPVTFTAGADGPVSVTGPATLVGPAGSGPAPAGFAINSDGCGAGATPGAPKSIAASGTCTVSVSYTGPTAPPAGAALNINTADGTKGVLLRAYSGKSTVCTPSCATKGMLTFSSVAGTPQVQTFEIKNGTSGATNLSNIGVVATGPYTADASGCSAPLGPNFHCSIIVTFNPTAAGSFPGTLKITSDDPIPGPTVTVNGTATARAVAPPSQLPGTNIGPGTSPGTSSVGKKPSVTGFTFSPKSITIGGKGSFKYTLAAAGRLTIKIDRRLPGKKVKYQHRGTLTVASARLGKNSTAFKGKFGGHALPKGTYRATISATNSLGRAMSKTTTFIVKSKKH